MSNSQTKNRNKGSNKTNRSNLISVRPSVTWAQAFRDIFIKAIDKGIWLPFSILLFLGYLSYRLPDEKVGILCEKIVDGLATGALMGWLLFIAAIIIGTYHARIMRRLYSKDMERVGKEKTMLQERILGNKLGSSNRVSLPEEER